MTNDTISHFRAHAWTFLRVQQSDDCEALPIAPRIFDDGPVIEYNREQVETEELEDPAFARFWIPMILHEFCMIVLREALSDDENGIGVLTGQGWQRFRDEVCKYMTIPWDKVLECAEREGEEYTAHSMALAMFAESRMQDRLLALGAGVSPLNVVSF